MNDNLRWMVNRITHEQLYEHKNNHDRGGHLCFSVLQGSKLSWHAFNSSEYYTIMLFLYKHI